MIGTTEIIVIAATGMVLFGASALPKFARSIGEAKKELEKGLKEGYEKADAVNESDGDREKAAPKKKGR